MSYYEDLRDAVHFRLKRIYEEQNKTFEQIYFELNVTSKETIRKLAGKDYWTWNPDLQTLEDLRKKLDIQVPDRSYRVSLTPGAQRDLDFVADYFSRFDDFQRHSILRFCEFTDSSRRHYETVPAVAEDAIPCDTEIRNRKEEQAADKSAQRDQPDSRKTD